MKPLLLLFTMSVSLVDVCFSESAFMKEMSDSRDMRQLKSGMQDISNQVRVANEQSGPSSADVILSTPAGSAEEQKLREAILAEKLKKMQAPFVPGIRVGGKISASAKMSQADKDKLVAKQEADAKYEARKLFEKQQKQARSEEIAKFNAELEKSTTDIGRCFPQALDPKNPLNAKANEVWKTLNEQKSPLVGQSDAPFIVYSMAATMLDIKPAMPR